MKKRPGPYTLVNVASAFLMIAALFWLTISAPFVLESKQKLAEQQNHTSLHFPISGTEEEANPLGNTTEEKAPNSSNSFSEEYIHDNHRSEFLLCVTSRFYKGENASVYVAFHGELLVPPPNIA
jgi:hypothetical protein